MTICFEMHKPNWNLTSVARVVKKYISESINDRRPTLDPFSPADSRDVSLWPTIFSPNVLTARKINLPNSSILNNFLRAGRKQLHILEYPQGLKIQHQSTKNVSNIVIFFYDVHTQRKTTENSPKIKFRQYMPWKRRTGKIPQQCYRGLQKNWCSLIINACQ